MDLHAFNLAYASLFDTMQLSQSAGELELTDRKEEVSIQINACFLHQEKR